MKIQRAAAGPAHSEHRAVERGVSANLDRSVFDEVQFSPPPARTLRRAAASVGAGIIGAALGQLHSWPAAVVGGAVGLATGYLLDRHLNDPHGYADQARLRAQNNAEQSEKALAYQQQVRSRRRQPIPPALPRETLLAVDAVAEIERRYDGYDSSRDLFALYADEGEHQARYRFQIEYANLRAGVEQDHLNTRLQLAWQGGSIELAVADDQQHSQGLNVYHAAEHSCLRLELDKPILRDAGWSDGQPLEIEVTTGADSLKGRTDQRLDPETLRRVHRWEGRTVYYAVTDRFHNGDANNDEGTDPGDPERFHGGDWQGVIDKLDELKKLGVDCIWLSCPYQNERDFLGMDGYHGYWPINFEKTEPGFGDKAKLKELCQKAHQQGMQVMLDVVVNHTGYNHPWANDPEHHDWFHHQGKIWGSDQVAMERGALAGLPDLAQENQQVSDYLIEVHKRWMDETGVDALRLDAVRHVPEPFLREFNEAMREGRDKYLSIGEAFWQDANFVAGYQNRTLDSMFDFRLAYAIRKVFASDPSRSQQERHALAAEVAPHNDQEAARLYEGPGGQSMRLLSEAFKDDKYYDNPRKLSIFVDNHDMIRFMSDCGGDRRKLGLALAFLYACRGLPTLYYGTEAGLEGSFPGNRGDLDRHPERPFSDLIAQLASARRNSDALTLGVQQELYCDDDGYALARVRPDETAVCLFNNSEQPKTMKVSLEAVGLGPDLRLRNLLSGEGVEVRNGTLEVTLEPKGFRYFSNR